MAGNSVIGKSCDRCGSSERRPNGQCAPCSRAASAAWKVRNENRIEASGEPRFYTYIHRRADDGKVFYVGKGRGYRATTSKNRNKHWLRTVDKHGILVEIVARWASESEAFEHEKLLIEQLRNANHQLCNYTDGGDGLSGYRHTEETRAMLSSMQVGRKLSAEHRAKLSAAGKGRVQSLRTKAKLLAANLGRKHTIEQNRRNGDARRGKQMPAGTGAKISAANKGHPVSEETRAKISAGRMGIKPSAHCIAMVKAANTGIVRSAEFRAKVSAGLTGRPVSAETRAKLSAIFKGRVISKEQRAKISKTLTGRRLSDAEKARLAPLTHSAEWRAKRSASMKGLPFGAHRTGQEG